MNPTLSFDATDYITNRSFAARFQKEIAAALERSLEEEEEPQSESEPE